MFDALHVSKSTFFIAGTYDGLFVSLTKRKTFARAEIYVRRPNYVIRNVTLGSIRLT